MRDQFGVSTRTLLVLLLCLSGPLVTVTAEQSQQEGSRPIRSNQPHHVRVSAVAEARPEVATSQRVSQPEKLPDASAVAGTAEPLYLTSSARRRLAQNATEATASPTPTTAPIVTPAPVTTPAATTAATPTPTTARTPNPTAATPTPTTARTPSPTTPSSRAPATTPTPTSTPTPAPPATPAATSSPVSTSPLAVIALSPSSPSTSPLTGSRNSSGVPAAAPSGSNATLPPAPAPGRANATSPARAPAPSESNTTVPAPAPNPQTNASNPTPAPASTPNLAPGQSNATAPTPNPSDQTNPYPAPAPNDQTPTATAPAPAPQNSSFPVPAPAPGPFAFAPAPGPFAFAPGPGAPGFAPATAPTPGPAAAAAAGQNQSAPAPAPAPAGEVVTPSGTLAPAPGPSGAALAGAGAAATPSALTPEAAAASPGSAFAPSPLYPYGTPAGGPAFAPAAAPAGSAALQEGALTFMTPANATALSIDPATGFVVAASSLAASQATGDIYTNQRDFTVRIQSKSALTASDIKVSNGDLQSVTPVSGTNSYDVSVSTKSQKAAVAVSTIASAAVAASTITVDVNTVAPQVTITSPQLVTDHTNPTITVNFGGRVAQLNPLLLYNVSGVTRTDVVYNVNAGIVAITAYVDNGSDGSDIRVTVDAGVTTDLNGNPNSAASQVVKYRPPSTAVSAVSHTANAVMGATIGASLLTGLLSGHAAAGVSTLLLFNYLQTFYWQSRMAVGHFPENYRQLAEGFSWSAFDVIAPWKIDESQDGISRAHSAVSSGFPYPAVGVTTQSFTTGSTSAPYFTLPASTATPAITTTASASRRLKAVSPYDVTPHDMTPFSRRSLMQITPSANPTPHAQDAFVRAPALAPGIAPGLAPAPAPVPASAPSAAASAQAGAPAPAMTIARGRRLLAGRADALEEDQQSSAQHLSDPASAVYYLRRHLLQTSNSSTNSSNGTLPSVLPGERLVVTSTGLQSEGNSTTNITGAAAYSRINDIEDSAMGTNLTSPYKRLIRVLFWFAILMAAVVLIHMAVLAAFLFSRWSTPDLLHFPRPELLVLFIALAAIAQGAANLFTGNGGQIAVGVILVLLLPVGFLVISGFFIWRYLYHPKTPQRRAAFIMLEDPDEPVAYKGNRAVRFLGEFLIGPLRPEGRWQTLKSPDSRFLRKYGVLFEDNRGPPMVVRGATWAVDPVTGYVNRGRLEYHLGRPLLSFRGRGLFYRYQLQGYAKLVSVLKVILVALLLNGISSGTSLAQVIALMVLSLLHMVFLRFFEPLCERGDLAVALIAEVCDAGVFVCGLILILGDSANDQFRLTLGLVMLGFKGVGFVAALVYNFFTSFRLAKEWLLRYAWPYIPCLAKRPQDKFADAVAMVMIQDKHILARKYADKWMGKALGVGLFKRRLSRKEVEDSRQVLYRSINPLARPSRMTRPSKGSPNSSPLAAQGVSNQPYQQSAVVPSHGSGPVTGPQLPVWDAAVANGHASHSSTDGSLSGPAPVVAVGSASPGRGRFSGFSNMFRPRRQQPALLDHTDPVLSSIAEGDADTGVVDASLHAYHSTDLDAANAAATANKTWAISSPSLSPRRTTPQASVSQASPSQAVYPVPSPFSTPVRSPAQSSSSPLRYPVPSPQNTPLRQTQSRSQSPAGSVGPFEAAARARALAAQGQAGNSPSVSRPITPSPGLSPSPVAYQVPSPANSSGQQRPGRTDTGPGRTAARALLPSTSTGGGTGAQPGRPMPSIVGDWSTGIAGMGTTRAAAPRSSNSAARHEQV